MKSPALTMSLPPEMRDLLQADAVRNGMTIGSAVRTILAAHYGLPETMIVADTLGRGGYRPNSGRKPTVKLVPVYQKPSMPNVNIRSD